ncbi:MAG: biopolymer transporter ExbD [Gammaproteobacteria bacterium]|nr:biopolymer transporter ExbD [Gammaproteobacteria bacterium]
MRSRWKRRRQHEAPELNITSFMNLMVILVPFLLITAVFSRMAILELNIPTTESVVEENGPEFSLEVIVRSDAIEVGDRNAGVLSHMPLIDGEYDLDGLNAYLKRVKATFPDQLAVTLLLESDVDYEALVQVMDAVRSYRVDEPGNFSRAELFPEISIGDAPLLAQGR